MTKPSFGLKKRKITYAASPQGVEKAEKALRRLGFESKINLAKSNLLSRSTVTKFFQGQPIQLDSFKKICEALTLDWQEIVPMCEEEQFKRLEINELSNSDTNEGVEQVQTLSYQVTILDKHRQFTKAEIILKGDVESVNNNLSLLFQAILREKAGDTIEITDIKEGSIRLIVEGSPEDIERLLSRFNSGELTEVSGFPVENVQILSESLDDDESNELNDKWRLVQEIVSRAVEGRNLSGADLSNADLSNVNLSGANLRSANLSDTDLSHADLSGADLSGADLSGADLSNARIDAQTKIDSKWRLAWEIVNQGARERDLKCIDLSGAFLSGANLRSANLSGANLRHANLSGAFLSGANLRSANLRSANLRSAFLSGANLRSANLRSANLRCANLSGAFLRGADLRGPFLIGVIGAFLIPGLLFLPILILLALITSLIDTDHSVAFLIGVTGVFLIKIIAFSSDSFLIGVTGVFLIGVFLIGVFLKLANLDGVVVEKAQFGANLGLTEEMKRELKRRGAIFDDSDGDDSEGYRSGVVSRH